jgi:hypothetical protein
MQGRGGGEEEEEEEEEAIPDILTSELDHYCLFIS